MAIAAPVILEEMKDWVALGGGNSGIVGDKNHTYGFHRAANEVPASDYSRYRDPNGSDGPYVNWNYACAGDFSHKNDPELRAMHRNVLQRLMNGELPMICEFIGKPWPDKPVYYWARWNGIKTLQKYTGKGHDHWSHISWYRSKVDQRAYLWVPTPQKPESPPAPTPAPSDWTKGLIMNLPTLKRGANNRTVKRLQGLLLSHNAHLKNQPGGFPIDGAFGPKTETAVKKFQAAYNLRVDGIVGQQTWTYLLMK